MPQHIPPMTLEDLSYNAVKNHLVELSQLLHDKRLSPRNFRCTWVTSLPGTVRTRLLEAAAEIKDGPIPFYLMGLLLAPDVDKVRVEICCYYGCSHQAAMLRLLATEGKGLKILELARSALLRLDQSLLQSVLLNTNVLQHLIIRNIATDATLAVIGTSCNQLITLDVSNSRQVSDGGIKQLFLKIEFRDKSNSSDCNDFAISITMKPRNGQWWNLQKIMRRMQLVMTRCKNKLPNECEESYNSILLECCEIPNAVSTTLKVLNISNTAVTSGGVLLALQNCDMLESIGEYSHLGRVLELFENKFVVPKLKLRNVHNTVTTSRTMSLIFNACPDITQLTVLDTQFFPSELNPESIPPKLKSLTLLGIPPIPIWLSQFYTFLNRLSSTLLRELVLKFYTTETLVHLELSTLLELCPMLKILVIDGSDVTWTSCTRHETLLEKVQIGQTVSGNVITNLIAVAPNLTAAHFYSCPDLLEEHLRNIISPTLKCFYIYETRVINTVGIVTEILANCPVIKYVGNINNWGGPPGSANYMLENLKDNNYEIQFNSGSHWYYSNCINKCE